MYLHDIYLKAYSIFLDNNILGIPHFMFLLNYFLVISGNNPPLDGYHVKTDTD